MTTYAFPNITPSSQQWGLESNTGAFISPYTGSSQTFDRGGERWKVSLGFEGLNNENRSTLQGFLTRLNGQQHRFTLENHAAINRGVFGGTPLVDGGANTGTTLQVDGATASVVNWIRVGDYFSVDGKLKVCVADANSSGAGLVDIEIMPRIQVAPADATPVITSSATGVFMLADNSVSWTNRPGGFADLTFSAVEDILL